MSSETETVDEVLARDLSHLQSLSAEQLEGLMDLVIGFLIDTKGSGFQEKLAQYAETHGMGGAALKTIVRASLLFLQRGVRAGWVTSQVTEACARIGLSPEVAEVIGRCWAQQSSNLTSSLLSKIVSANQLMDVDWSFGVTAASNDCDQVGKTYLQMKLTVDSGEGGRLVFMELSLDQFYHFMAQMEKAKAYLDFVAADIRNYSLSQRIKSRISDQTLPDST